MNTPLPRHPYPETNMRISDYPDLFDETEPDGTPVYVRPSTRSKRSRHVGFPTKHPIRGSTTGSRRLLGSTRRRITARRPFRRSPTRPGMRSSLLMRLFRGLAVTDTFLKWSPNWKTHVLFYSTHRN